MRAAGLGGDTERLSSFSSQTRRVGDAGRMPGRRRPLGNWAHRSGAQVRGRTGRSYFHCSLGELVAGDTGSISSDREQRAAPGDAGRSLTGCRRARSERVWEDRPSERVLPARPGQQGQFRRAG